MSLIDYTFFAGGELSIPNLDKPGILEDLNRFIIQYEDEFLTKALGYDLYHQMLDGLAENTVADKWVRLVYGYQSWKGIIESAILSGSSLNGYRYKEPVIIKMGITPGFALITGAIVVPSWVGYEILVEKIGYGTQVKDEQYTWDKTTGTWQLLDPETGLATPFETGIQYLVQFVPNPTFLANSVGSSRKSMIANYVYYCYTRNNVTTTTGVGETKEAYANATAASNWAKSAKAWNDMRKRVCNMYEFMSSDYGTFNKCSFGYMNPLF